MISFSPLRRLFEWLFVPPKRHCPDCGDVHTAYTEINNFGLADEVCLECGRVVGG